MVLARYLLRAKTVMHTIAAINKTAAQDNMTLTLGVKDLIEFIKPI